MVLLLQILASILIVVAGAAAAYYWLLAIVSLLRRRSGPASPGGESPTFAIIIPAHDEEKLIAGTLRSCDALDYPRDRFRVYVIADNCSDRTSAVARGLGATCLEREDELRRGKGHALAFAFAHIDLAAYDALLVMDADCRIAPNALRAFSSYLLQGEKALQANCFVGNPDDSPVSYALAVGSVIENRLFYAGKSYLGLGVLLRGTGFVLRRDVLMEHPWTAHSIVEDIEYSIALLRHRVGIRFVPETAVYSQFPVDSEQLGVQRARWAGGNLRHGRKAALGLMAEALRSRNVPLFDAGFTFLVLSRPLMILTSCLGVLLAGWARAIGPDDRLEALLPVALGVFAILAAYFVLGILLLGLSPKRLGFLVRAPITVLRLAAISLRSLVDSRSDTWARTPR